MKAIFALDYVHANEWVTRHSLDCGCRCIDKVISKTKFGCYFVTLNLFQDC